MITQQDQNTVKEITDYLSKQVVFCGDNFDESKVHWLYTLEKLVDNLKIAPVSYRPCTEDDEKAYYYTAECPACGWWGSSCLLCGGQSIGDTGDYSDCYCPVCHSTDIDEKD